MKISELMINHKIIVQLAWGEQKIEFSSEIVANDETGVYISPYIHNGSELELNVNASKGVFCNIYTDAPATKKRISWKNVELSTVEKNNKLLYQLKTNGFNSISTNDDRRKMERIIVHIKAQVCDLTSKTYTDVIIHDISDNGISFYAPSHFAPVSTQLMITFEDTIDDKQFNVKVECVVTRTTKKAGNNFIGCKIIGENREYLLYRFMLQLKDKDVSVKENDTAEDKSEDNKEE